MYTVYKIYAAYTVYRVYTAYTVYRVYTAYTVYRVYTRTFHSSAFHRTCKDAATAVHTHAGLVVYVNSMLSGRPHSSAASTLEPIHDDDREMRDER